MFVPIIPHTTVINKTIVYSDTVLPVKDLGENLKVCSISNVSESELEQCLKTIFESNPNVVFNTIQYSKENKKVYFYTDKSISTKAWEESKFTKYEPLNSSSEILEEVKRIFISDKNKDDDCISLYDVAKLIKKVNDYYDKKRDRYGSRLDNMVKSKFSSLASIVIYGFDYNNNELSIGFTLDVWNNKHNKITFSKRNGDLYIVKSESSYGNEILTVIGNELSKLYDELINFSSSKSGWWIVLKTVNSVFPVSISSYGVKVFLNNLINPFKKDFELTSYSYSDDYKYDCNSNVVITAIQGKEDELFKKIFVKIEDCPEWAQTTLSEIRQNQLAKEMKIQKRLELKRKFFPWLKNN